MKTFELNIDDEHVDEFIEILYSMTQLHANVCLECGKITIVGTN